MEHPKLASWWDLPGWAATECGVYLLAASMAASAILLTLALVSGITAILTGSKRPYIFLRRAAALVVAAVACGMPANLAFVAWLRYHYYVPGDPVVDWLPFFPTGAWIIDTQFGGRFINGGDQAMLEKAWLLFAVPVWAGAWWLHRRWLRNHSCADWASR